MHSNFLATILVAISVAKGVLSVPLAISHGEATTDEEKANLASLEKATAEANRQIPYMEKVLADPTDEKHKPLIEAAFGKDPSLDLEQVKANVQRLKTGTIPVHLPSAPGGKTLAYTQYDAEVPPMNPTHVEFGKKYHKSADSTRAGTLIHEATHFLGNTGDSIKDGQMLKGDQPETDLRGYASKTNPYKTPKSLNSDTIWTNMRDSTKNMHDNAEAYSQFASLCSNAKLSRRELHNFRRALASGDDDAAITFLAKRSSCALPKDYFTKKATGKATTGAASIKKASAAISKSNTPAGSKLKGSAALPNAKGPKTLRTKGSKVNLAKAKKTIGHSKVAVPKTSDTTKAESAMKIPPGRLRGTAKVGTRLTIKKALGTSARGGKQLSSAKSPVGTLKKSATAQRFAKTGSSKGALKAGTSKLRPISKTTAASKRVRPSLLLKSTRTKGLMKLSAAKRPGITTKTNFGKSASKAAGTHQVTSKAKKTTTGAAMLKRPSPKNVVKHATAKKSNAKLAKAGMPKKVVTTKGSKPALNSKPVKASSRRVPKKLGTTHVSAKSRVPKKSTGVKTHFKGAAASKKKTLQKVASRVSSKPKVPSSAKSAPRKIHQTAPKAARTKSATRKTTSKVAATAKAKSAPKNGPIIARPKTATKAKASKKGRRDLEFEY